MIKAPLPHSHALTVTATTVALVMATVIVSLVFVDATIAFRSFVFGPGFCVKDMVSFLV